jgi:hypothetical protein
MAMTAIARRKTLAWATAIGGWGSLGLQLAIMLQTMPAASAMWRFLSFFTILTNMLVAAMATRIALGRDGGISGPVARMAITAAILLVGIVYWLLLASQWHPTGWQLVADIGLHSVEPVLAAALWFVSRDGSLKWRDLPKATIWPAAFAVYALARGAVDGWYAYWFLNPRDQSLIELIISIVGLSLLVMAIGAVLIAIDRAHGRLRGQHQE